jgi:[ribosomal protein S18]-alanine N-acetyltransferase
VRQFRVHLTVTPIPSSDEIRFATSSDILGILALERASETSAHWSEEEYRRMSSVGTPERIAFVAYELETLTGFLIARVLGGEWELENIVVAQNARRRGLGKRLLARLLETARQRAATSVFLEVRASNQPARALYAANGFQEYGLRKTYYDAPVEDAVVYRLDF